MGTPFTKQARLDWMENFNNVLVQSSREITESTGNMSDKHLALISVNTLAVANYLSVIAECMVRSAK